MNSPVQTKVSEAAKQAVLSAVNFLEEQGFEIEETEPNRIFTFFERDEVYLKAS